VSIKSKIQSLITAANAKTGESDATLTDAVQTLVDGYGQGGTTITDGIVVKARNANGYPTEIDFYGDAVSDFMFGQGSNNTVGWMYLAEVNYKTDCKTLNQYAFSYSGKNSGSPCPIPQNLETLGQGAFRASHYVSATLPVSLSGRLADLVFAGNVDLVSVIATGITSLATSGGQGNGQFYGCTGLQTVEIGSVGYGITDSRTWCFRNCTQTGLTITLYTTGSYTDTLVSNIRSSATHATIIIKASEATTYNGTSYAAGDTILTSEVTS
jgi:hypothetical protein